VIVSFAPFLFFTVLSFSFSVVACVCTPLYLCASGKIYLLGALGDGRFTTNCYSYDVKTDTYATIASMPKDRSSCPAVSTPDGWTCVP
jgi:hypothetical protein